ncbi:MAG: HNH endonuclease, partial [Thermoplasmata archaeon]
MPPSAIKSVRDLIYWQYAKIIADSAGMGKRNWRFVMDRFKKLQQQEIFWNEIREYVKEHENPGECIFCGDRGTLTLEHLFPRSLRGPQKEKNVVWVCKRCNSEKGARRPYEWYTRRSGLKAAKYDVPRIAEGKYLKLAYEILGEGGLLDVSVEDLRVRVCPNCDLGDLCVEEDSVGKLSVLCLDGMVGVCL